MDMEVGIAGYRGMFSGVVSDGGMQSGGSGIRFRCCRDV